MTNPYEIRDTTARPDPVDLIERLNDMANYLQWKDGLLEQLKQHIETCTPPRMAIYDPRPLWDEPKTAVCTNCFKTWTLERDE